MTGFIAGNAAEFQSNLKEAIVTGQFERDFPDGVWKEVLKSGALGVPMDTAKLQQHQTGWAELQQKVDADIGMIRNSNFFLKFILF